MSPFGICQQKYVFFLKFLTDSTQNPVGSTSIATLDWFIKFRKVLLKNRIRQIFPESRRNPGEKAVGRCTLVNVTSCDSESYCGSFNYLPLCTARSLVKALSCHNSCRRKITTPTMTNTRFSNYSSSGFPCVVVVFFLLIKQLLTDFCQAGAKYPQRDDKRYFDTGKIGREDVDAFVTTSGSVVTSWITGSVLCLSI